MWSALIEMCRQCKIQSKFWRLCVKTECELSHWSFLYWSHAEFVILGKTKHGVKIHFSHFFSLFSVWLLENLELLYTWYICLLDSVRLANYLRKDRRSGLDTLTDLWSCRILWFPPTTSVTYLTIFTIWVNKGLVRVHEVTLFPLLTGLTRSGTFCGL